MARVCTSLTDILEPMCRKIVTEFPGPETFGSSAFRPGQTVLASGGALGADSAFGRCAAAAGHTVVHWSFHGHKRCESVPRAHAVNVPDELLTKWTLPLVRLAAPSLGKSAPSKPHVRQLLTRNGLQVVWAEAVYVATWMDTKSPSQHQVGGGTGWAVQMYFDICRLANRTPRVHWYEVNSRQWLDWDSERSQWRTLPPGSLPPKPSGIYAGIGNCRDLTSPHSSSQELNSFPPTYHPRTVSHAAPLPHPSRLTLTSCATGG